MNIRLPVSRNEMARSNIAKCDGRSMVYPLKVCCMYSHHLQARVSHDSLKVRRSRLGPKRRHSSRRGGVGHQILTEIKHK